MTVLSHHSSKRMPQPSPALLARTSQIHKATFAVKQAARGLCHDAYLEGFRFPDLYDDTIREIERQLDRLALLTSPSRLHYFADDLPRRNDPASPSTAEAPSKD